MSLPTSLTPVKMTRQAVINSVKGQIEDNFYKDTVPDLEYLLTLTDQELEDWYNEFHNGVYCLYAITIIPE
jgi:hypothetical protein